MKRMVMSTRSLVCTLLILSLASLAACAPDTKGGDSDARDADTSEEADTETADVDSGDEDVADSSESDAPDTTDAADGTDVQWVTRTFTEDETDILNPERGVYGQYGLDHDFSDARNDGHTLARLVVRLDDYRDRDLDEALLDRLRASFDSARQAGIKLVPRFAYNAGPWPDSEPDASLEQILRHIEQLEPILQDNAELIPFFEAGFIGAWGEWHTSTHGLDDSEDAKRQIVQALLDALPDDRAVMLRYPPDLYDIFGAPADASSWFDGSTTARLGHTNDCFLASDTDRGTYARSDKSIAEEKDIIAELGLYAPVGGETCASNPPRTDCQTALAELEQLRWTHLNEAYHPDVIDGFKNGDSEGQTCWDEIRTHLGYRYVLEQARHPEVVQTGSQLTVELTLRNGGWAPSYTERPAFLVLAGEGTAESIEVELDLRPVAPGATETVEVSAILPDNLAPGSYTLHLWMPDASGELRDDPRYAIRFANEGMWDADTGYNQLSAELEVE